MLRILLPRRVPGSGRRGRILLAAKLPRIILLPAGAVPAGVCRVKIPADAEKGKIRKPTFTI